MPLGMETTRSLGAGVGGTVYHIIGAGGRNREYGCMLEGGREGKMGYQG